MFRDAAKKALLPAITISIPVEDKTQRPGVSSSFGNIYSTENLGSLAGSKDNDAKNPAVPADKKGMGGGLFSPNNLKKQSGSE